MVLTKANCFILFSIMFDLCLKVPGRHVHHRIHVPTKVKTVYHTKIIKIPEHHHYIHEKEKPRLVKIPEHHYYFHEKEKGHPLDFYKDDDLDEDYDKEPEGSFGYRDSYGFYHRNRDHSIFKKHTPRRYYKKRKH